MNLNSLIILSLLSFLLGSIPFSYIVTKLVGKKDIRNIGSGNPGATNVMRALNAWYGLLVVTLDISKGLIPVYLAKTTGYRELVIAVALSVVLGHDYSIFLRFRGGKGVATSLGVFMVLAPIPTLLVTVIFFTMTAVFKFVSFGSVMASFSYPIIAYLLGYRQYIGLAVLLGALIIYRHKSNLYRLWHGKENRAI